MIYSASTKCLYRHLSSNRFLYLNKETAANNDLDLAKQSGDVKKLKDHYKNLVENSKLNYEDKKACIEGLDSDERNNTIEGVTNLLKWLPESEKASEKNDTDFEKKLKKLSSPGADGITVIAPKSEKAYMDWFKSLSFADRVKYKEKSDLDDPRRKELCKVFGGKAPVKIGIDRVELAQDGERLPRVVREELLDKFNNADLQEREKLLCDAIKKHTELKAIFLALPTKLQEKYKNEFKISNFEEREKLLQKIKRETETNPQKKETAKEISKKESAESKSLERSFESKMAGKVRENLFSPGSINGEKGKQGYSQWFAGLSLAEKREKLQKSDLDDPERVLVRDAFYSLAAAKNPEKDPRYNMEFRNADLDKRKEILNKLAPNWKELATDGKWHAQKQMDSPQKKGLLQRIIKRIVGSTQNSKVEESMESFAIGSEIARRRARYQIAHNDRSNTTEHAQKKGLKKAVERTQELQETATKSEYLSEKTDNNLRLKMDTLESRKDDRRNLKKILKPELDNKDIQLAGGINLRTRSGDLIKDAREYQKTELHKEQLRVQEAIAPILSLEARRAGLTLDKKETDEALSQAQWDEMGKDIIRKSA